MVQWLRFCDFNAGGHNFSIWSVNEDPICHMLQPNKIKLLSVYTLSFPFIFVLYWQLPLFDIFLVYLCICSFPHSFLALFSVQLGCEGCGELCLPVHYCSLGSWVSDLHREYAH